MTEQEMAGAGLLAGFGLMMLAIWFAIALVLFASIWKLFTKAGQPGWAAIIPFYNTYVMVVPICGLHIMWFIFFFVPVLNMVASIYLPFKLASAYGKGAGFGIGLILLPFIFLPLLAFGSSTWVGAGDAQAAPAPAA